jgi:hypothetical protein
MPPYCFQKLNFLFSSRTCFKGTVQRDGSNRGFERSSLKSEAKRFLEKFARPPRYESPLKLQHRLLRLLAVWKQIADGAHNSVSGLLFTSPNSQPKNKKAL